ncbi:MAG TPA: HEAT repeat domain-containing protein [Polyangiaceae bacterium]|nr:HEAT repeat domain-containing protein [Polyangiaceae bacterium]
MSRKCAAVGFALLAVISAAPPAWADFSARGRVRKSAPVSTAPRRPASASKAPAKSEQGPDSHSSAALIERYTALALAQPETSFPVERLAQLYRQRDGDLQQLIAQFEALSQTSGADAYNARLALAAIYEQANKLDLAIARYQTLANERPQSPLPLLRLAHLFTARADLPSARTEYEKALGLLKDETQIEQIRRTLRGLCLDLNDLPAARRYQEMLVAQAKGSFFVQSELANELAARGNDAQAEAEFRKLVEHSSGDNRTLSSALRGLASVLGKEHKYDEALHTFERALALATDSGLRREILMQSAALYRAADRTTELIARLEKQGAADADSERLLASLYEESGQLDKALHAYQRVVQREPRDANTHLKLIQLLQLQGRLNEAISEYERLIQSAPNNPQYVLELAQARLQRGERDKALSLLQSLETRSAGDADALQTLVDFYERIGEDQRALNVLERATHEGHVDPNSFIELGNRYFKAGQNQRAEETWKRVLQVGGNSARSWQTLGDVYLEHEKIDSALDAYRHALKLAPNDPALRKAYASALERGASDLPNSARRQQYDEAQTVWQALLTDPASSEQLAHEARQHIVTLWSLSGDLSQRLAPLARRLHQSPPDLPAGQLLAEAQIRLRRYADAEQTLRSLQHNLPGDRPLALSLERVLVLQRKLVDAIPVLEGLTRSDPQRAREYYQRMAQYAGELYQDDRALEYATRVVELGPDDADSHLKLAELYRRRQNPNKAIEHFRMALGKNERLFPAYLELSELLINRGDFDSADQLLGRVATLSPDDELVAAALRQRIQLNMGHNSLESLEKDLLPLALANPNRVVYRRLLVELYGALCLPLFSHADPNDGEHAAASEQLARIGQRAVKPLLDALNDSDESQQRTAIELLSKLHNSSAAPALFAYAAGAADPVRRARALLSASTLMGAAAVPHLRPFLFRGEAPKADDGDPVSVAAVWALAQTRSRAATHPLMQLLRVSNGSVRALSALGLGFAGDPAVVSSLQSIALSDSEEQIVRAAAVYALATLGAVQNSERFVPLAKLSDPDVQATVLLALGRMRTPGLDQLIATALLSNDTALQHAALAAAVAHSAQPRSVDAPTLADPAGAVDVHEILHGLIPHAYSEKDEAAVLESVSLALEQQAMLALHGSSTEALRVLEFLKARTTQASVQPAIQEITTALVPAIADLFDHPLPAVRTAALNFLSTRKEPAAQACVVRALSDSDPQVQTLALDRVTTLDHPEATAAVLNLLSGSSSWALRVGAARALGHRSGAPSDNASRQRVLNALSSAAQSDEVALVRQAALEALFAFDPQAAKPALKYAMAHDLEPAVRQRAKNLLLGESPSTP